MRQSYTEKLDDLKIEVLRMGALVEDAITKASYSLLRQEVSLAEEVLRNEEHINKYETIIEDKCVILVATEQPVAHDLRLIISTLKSIRDLERIGDYAAHLASIARNLIGGNFLEKFSLPLHNNIKKMFEMCVEMIKKTMQAFREEDAGIAREVMEFDEQVDSLYLDVFKEFLGDMKQDPSYAHQLNSLIFVSKYLERLADHVINICEEIIYIQTGERVEKQN
ncbi:MAG: phosphate signaling complex protein PhoU [Spirochaetales bacterium]|nr:phosphate signaling complex protein PhoU [Spirochaetales bacterium]